MLKLLLTILLVLLLLPFFGTLLSLFFYVFIENTVIVSLIILIILLAIFIPSTNVKEKFLKRKKKLELEKKINDEKIKEAEQEIRNVRRINSKKFTAKEMELLNENISFEEALSGIKSEDNATLFIEKSLYNEFYLSPLQKELLFKLSQIPNEKFRKIDKLVLSQMSYYPRYIIGTYFLNDIILLISEQDNMSIQGKEFERIIKGRKPGNDQSWVLDYMNEKGIQIVPYGNIWFNFHATDYLKDMEFEYEQDIQEAQIKLTEKFSKLQSELVNFNMERDSHFDSDKKNYLEIYEPLLSDNKYIGIEEKIEFHPSLKFTNNSYFLDYNQVTFHFKLEANYNGGIFYNSQLEVSMATVISFFEDELFSVLNNKNIPFEENIDELNDLMKHPEEKSILKWKIGPLNKESLDKHWPIIKQLFYCVNFDKWSQIEEHLRKFLNKNIEY